MSLEIRDRLGLAVVGEDKVGPLEIKGRLAVSVRNEDLNELQGDSDFMLE